MFMALIASDKVAVITLDSPGYAAGARVVRHQDKIASRQADKSGKGCALVATLVLLDLDDKFLALAECILDAEPAGRFPGCTAEVGTCDFLEWQKAMSVAAIVDKCRLETGLDTGYLSLVYVGLFLAAGRNLDIKIVEFLAIDHGHTQFFRLRGID
jgi:hypothetical protein